MTKRQPDEPEVSRPRSLIVDVLDPRRDASAHVEQGQRRRPHKTPTWVVFYAAGAVFVIALFGMEIFKDRPAAGVGADATSTCRDVDGAAAAIRTTVDAYARSETDVVWFDQRHINREIRTTRGCSITVFGEIDFRWSDNTSTTEAFDAIAVPARDGSRGWQVDGPFFYDRADSGVVQ